VRVEFGTTENAQMATALGALPAITDDGVIAYAEGVGDGYFETYAYGRGFHSSTYQLNLSRFGD
jgi:hypothetical protein